MPSTKIKSKIITPKVEPPMLSFSTTKELNLWLAKNYTAESGVWMRIFKIKSGVETVSYAEALDIALCYGWIDGLKRAYDEASWIQKFTPRRARSIWSKKNREHIARLEKAGKMKAPGRIQVEAAKADGRWEQAYDSPANMVVPPEFLKELAKNKKAEFFFNTLNKANRYAIVWRLQTAKKPETKDKRMKAILEMLKKGEKFHP